MITEAWKLLASFALIAIGGGCGVSRGLPSHGGGKRFFEEQRVVASAIRESLAEMNLAELRGKQVQIVVRGIAHDGSATITWPGLDAVAARADVRNTEFENARRTISEGYYDDNTSDSIGGGLSASYRLQSRYSPDPSRTSEDMNYLRAALEMKAIHSGVQVKPGGVPIVLAVLVDVLGTDRSRHDMLFRVHDDLKAACELTYYAADLSDGSLLFPARRAAAESTYRESRLRGLDRLDTTRRTFKINPTPMPVESPQP